MISVSISYLSNLFYSIFNLEVYNDKLEDKIKRLCWKDRQLLLFMAIRLSQQIARTGSSLHASSLLYRLCMSINPTCFFVAIAFFRLYRNYGSILHPVLAFFMDLSLMIRPNSHIIILLNSAGSIAYPVFCKHAMFFLCRIRPDIF